MTDSTWMTVPRHLSSEYNVVIMDKGGYLVQDNYIDRGSLDQARLWKNFEIMERFLEGEESRQAAQNAQGAFVVQMVEVIYEEVGESPNSQMITRRKLMHTVSIIPLHLLLVNQQDPEQT
jgi:hypothetical protein